MLGLLESDDKAQIPDFGIIDGIDSEVQQLLPGLAIPHNADKIPMSENGGALVNCDEAASALREVSRR